MINLIRKYRVFTRTMAMSVVCLVTVNSFVLPGVAANRGLNRTTLSAQSRFAALEAEGIEDSLQTQAEILMGAKLLLDGKTYSAVNGILIENHADGIEQGTSNIEFLPDPEVSSGGKNVKARFVVKGREDLIFEVDESGGVRKPAGTKVAEEEAPAIFGEEDIQRILYETVTNLSGIDELDIQINPEDDHETIVSKVNDAFSKKEDKSGAFFLIKNSLDTLKVLPLVLENYSIGQDVEVSFAHMGYILMLRTSKGGYAVKKYRKFRPEHVNGIPHEEYAAYEDGFIKHLRGRGVMSPSMILTKDNMRVLSSDIGHYAMYEQFDGIEYESLTDVLEPGRLESIGRAVARFHEAAMDHEPKGEAKRATPMPGPWDGISLGDIQKTREELTEFYERWIQRRGDEEYVKFFEGDTPVTFFIKNYDRFMGLFTQMETGVQDAGGYEALPDASVHGDLTIPNNMYFREGEAIAPFDLELSTRVKRIDEFGSIFEHFLLQNLEGSTFANAENINSLLIRFYGAYQDALPEDKKLSYSEASLIEEVYRRFQLSVVIRYLLFTDENAERMLSMNTEWADKSVRFAEAVDTLDWDALVQAIASPDADMQKEARADRLDRKKLENENDDEQYLITRAERHLKKHPVNTYIDLSSIPVEEGQLEHNMETLAKMITWHNTFGLNVRYVLENDADGQALAMLKDKLSEELAALVGLPYLAGEEIELSGGEKMTVKEDELIDIRLENLGSIGKDRFIGDREYVVALKEDVSRRGTAIPNYTAASAMGLSLAALRVARDNVEGQPDGQAEYEQFRGNIYDKFREIYKRYDLISKKRPFSEDELELIVMGSSATKLYYAVLYALPPAAKTVEAIHKYHEMMQDVLVAA